MKKILVMPVDMEFRIDIGEVYIHVQSFYRFRGFFFNISRVTNREMVIIPRSILAALHGPETCNARVPVIKEYQNRKSNGNLK
jgi:hypothetical protein